MVATVWIVSGWLGALLIAATPTPGFADATDSWITAKTKIAMITAEGVNGTAVNVDTVDGSVTLHGKVTSEAEKTQAESVARGIDGVRQVRNLLQVVPESAESAVKATDAEIEQRVKQALEADKSLGDSSISVQSVNQGMVLLAGEAKTMGDHLEAIRAARSVPGVRRVTSEIKSPDRLADADVQKMTDTGTPQDTKRGVDDVASDMYITSATKLRLIADSVTPALDINVDTTNGVVTLFGIVPSEQASLAAAANARKVSGVKRVVNELQVVPERQQDAIAANDEDVEAAVEQAIEKRSDLDDASIEVEVKDGVARLSGTVASEDDRLSAAMAARSTRGVRSVLWNDLQVNPSS
jgi:hyperosmotically inducible protein